MNCTGTRECDLILQIYIPRWRYARCLNSDRVDSGDFPRGGVVHALTRFNEESDRILKGENVLANRILCTVYDSGAIRIQVWRAIMRSALYIHERNLPYTTPTWRVIRGQDSPERMRGIFNRQHCCPVGGLEN